jgi:flagellar L-ring protein precursor FlgH
MKRLTVTKQASLGAAPVLALLLTGLAAGCGGVSHVGAYVPKHRVYDPPAASKRGEEPPSPGSLWRDGRSTAQLYTDARALRENDLLVVRVEELADAKRSADTDVAHQSQSSATLAFLKAAGAAGAAGVGPQVQLKGGLDQSFRGAGSTGRSERLIATVPALVRQVLPNGNLFIEGHRVVLVNSEEQHFYISGVVRPIDIDQQNSVKSSMIADAEIEFTGRGALTDNQRQGWLAKNLGWLWPF